MERVPPGSRRPAGGAETTRQLAVETTALPGAARGNVRPTGKRVSSFKFEVSSCRWGSEGVGEREFRRPKSEGRKKSEGRWPNAERNPKAEVRRSSLDRQHGRNISVVTVNGFGFRRSGFFRFRGFGFRIEWKEWTRVELVPPGSAGVPPAGRKRPSYSPQRRRRSQGAARGDAHLTGRGVSRFKLDVSSCRWRLEGVGEREFRRSKSEGRKKSEDRWPKAEKSLKAEGRRASLDRQLGRNISAVAVNGFGFWYSAFFRVSGVRISD